MSRFYCEETYKEIIEQFRVDLCTDLLTERERVCTHALIAQHDATVAIGGDALERISLDCPFQPGNWASKLESNAYLLRTRSQERGYWEDGCGNYNWYLSLQAMENVAKDVPEWARGPLKEDPKVAAARVVKAETLRAAKKAKRKAEREEAKAAKEAEREAAAELVRQCREAKAAKKAAPEHRYYVYLISCQEGIIRYVGKGSNGRWMVHMQRPELAEFDELNIKILFCANEDASFKLEDELIIKHDTPDLFNVIGKLEVAA